MTKEQVGKFTLLNARLSFPSLFEPNVQKQDDGTIRENWKANFLLENDRIDEMEAVFRGKRMSAKEAITLASNEAKAAKWGDDKAKWPKLKPDRKFFRDGNLENWDGLRGRLVHLGQRPANGSPVDHHQPQGRQRQVDRSRTGRQGIALCGLLHQRRSGDLVSGQRAREAHQRAGQRPCSSSLTVKPSPVLVLSIRTKSSRTTWRALKVLSAAILTTVTTT